MRTFFHSAFYSSSYSSPACSTRDIQLKPLFLFWVPVVLTYCSSLYVLSQWYFLSSHSSFLSSNQHHIFSQQLLSDEGVFISIPELATNPSALILTQLPRCNQRRRFCQRQISLSVGHPALKWMLYHSIAWSRSISTLRLRHPAWLRKLLLPKSLLNPPNV